MKIKTTIIIQAISILAIAVNLLFLNNAILGLTFFVIYFAVNSILLKNWLQKITSLSSLLFSSFLIISFISLIGAGIYFFYQLNNWIIISILVLTAGLILLLNKKSTKIDIPRLPKIQFNKTSFFLAFIYLIFFVSLIIILFENQTDQAIQSPWHQIPTYFFVLYFLATLTLILLVTLSKNKALSLLSISIHYLLSFSVALIIYKLGYGFDPFIHQTTEKIIYDQGFILPKPFYYLGQYSLVVILAKTTQLSIYFWDKILLIATASIYLPYIIYNSLRCLNEKFNDNVLLASLAFLIFPFSYLINTAPQGLANLYSIIVIFLSLLFFKNKLSIWFLLFLTMTALAIHALAGIPILIFIFLISFYKRKSSTKKIFIPIISVIASGLIPLTFILNAKLSGQNITWHFSGFWEKINIFKTYYLHYSIRDIVYFIGFNYVFFTILLGILAFVFFLRKEKQKFIFYFLISFSIILINFFLIKKFIVFEELIEYERNSYALRLIQLALFLLFPAILHMSTKIVHNIKTKGFLSLKIFSALFFAALICSSFYISYPRFDNYEANSGYNVSIDDFKTAQFIHDQSLNEQYIVLAPQTTAAAALSLYGFSNYYNDYFYYPIPTGGKLYQYFLKMACEYPTKQTAIEAMELTQTENLYFVIPQYWKNSTQVIDQAKNEAEQSFQKENQNYIFKFEK